METRAFLDTHVVVAVASEKSRVLSKAARRCLERSITLCYSPIVGLELQFLWEIRRIKMEPQQILRDAARVLDIKACDAPLGEIAEAAAALRWTRDPFDRLIVAQAALENAPLVTRDETILAHYPHAVW